MALEVRDYQQHVIDAVRDDWRSGVDSTLVVAATGTGKTVMFLSLLSALAESGELTRALIIAHRRELIYQPIERAAQFYPELAAGMGVVMADEDDAGARVVVATIQTLNAGERLARVLSHGAFSHVIVDEAHHTTADTYLSVLEALKAANPDVKVLGLTATPMRTDKDGLSRVYRKCSYRLPINEAIRRGALVKFDALGFTLPVSFAEIRETADGWDVEEAGDLLKAENVLEIVFEKWSEYCADRQTIMFTASVAQARQTAAYFAERGVAAEWVSGETPRAERDRILRAYQAGAVKLIANCMVLTEGFDAPETGAVLMVAPTKSDLIYVQRLGRGLRTAPGKVDCRVLDFAPIEARNIVMAGDVLGTPRDVAKAQAKAEKSGVLCALSVDMFGEASAVDPGELMVKVLDLLRKDALAWTVDGLYATATLSEEAMLAVALPDPRRMAKAELLRRSGQWSDVRESLYRFVSRCRLYLVTKDEQSARWSAEQYGEFESFDEAKAKADELGFTVDPRLARKDQNWRRTGVSDKQGQFMRRLGIDVPAGCSKGQASQLISARLASNTVRSAEQEREAAVLRTHAAI
jgi:superfamily II DNA or RNA helicase